MKLVGSLKLEGKIEANVSMRMHASLKLRGEEYVEMEHVHRYSKNL